MVWDGVERRAKKRYGVQGCAVEFKKAEPLDVIKSYSRRHLVLNISEIGCCFITQTYFKPGEKLRLKITAPLIKSSINVTAKVIWSKKSEDVDAYRMGLEFCNVSPNSRNLLKIMLENAVLDSIAVSTRTYLKEIKKL